MKTRSTLVWHTLFVVCFIFFASGTIAQQKPDTQTPAKKTITIHVTKEVDGNVVVIDTTVVTEGDFDADAYLMEKGVLQYIPETDGNIRRNVIIVKPDEDMEWTESGKQSGDTIILNDKRVYVYSDNFDIETPEAPCHHYQFEMPGEFSHFNEQVLKGMMDGFAQSYGLDDMMPFGDMKQVVVKKKRNGKKVIITFEDSDKSKTNHVKKEEKVIILHDSDMGDLQQSDNRVIINGNTGEKIILNESVAPGTNQKHVTVEVETDKKAPEKNQTKVIIIKEGEEK